jgi:glyoxylase-like metal-dependent hydrolase (beta-lactamase superfamily II)
MFVRENGGIEELARGIGRITLPLPLAPGHVHCYVLRGEHGRLLVDTGLGLPGLADLFQAELKERVDRIVITHFHPDHVWGGSVARSVTGATVHQGRLDYEQCRRVWGDERWPERIAGWFRVHGTPPLVADEVVEQGRAVAPLIQFARDPEPLQDGDIVDGWQVVELPGHADGHLGFLRGGVLAAGDHLLPDITPTVGLYPDSRPDPLRSYFGSLERTIELAPTLVLPSHGDPIKEPAARAAAILRHHEERLQATAAALPGNPLTAYEISLELFAADLGPSNRRFAVAETLSHLEHLVGSGGARRHGDGSLVTYTAA